MITSRRRHLRRWTVPVAAIATAFLAGCARNAPQDTFQPAGKDARTIDNLQRWPFYAAGGVGVIVMLLVIFTVWRYRDRGQAIPHQGHGNPAVEIGTIAFSAVLLASIAVPTVRGIWDLAETNDCKMTVNVTGQQWWWEYAYPAQTVKSADGTSTELKAPIVTSGQLVIPTGQCVLLRITSRDVIHSFWIPKLNGKKDAVPGRVHLLRMEADKPGMYEGQCTEFCGLSHANMKMDLIALSPADFAAWVGKQSAYAVAVADQTTAAGKGEAVFKAQCARCHQINGLVDTKGNPIIAAADQNLVSGAAPNLTHIMSRTTFAGATYSLLTEECRATLLATPSESFGAAYLGGVSAGCLNVVELKEWLRNAPEKKPMYPKTKAAGKGRGMPALGLSEDQIDQVVAYLKTLQ